MAKKGKTPHHTSDDAPGYPPYPSDEDIYRQEDELGDADPEDPSQSKQGNVSDPDAPNESDDEKSRMGDDLDVPGAELDDTDESIGEEDEENNYYSLDDNDDDRSS